MTAAIGRCLSKARYLTNVAVNGRYWYVLVVDSFWTDYDFIIDVSNLSQMAHKRKVWDALEAGQVREAQVVGDRMAILSPHDSGSYVTVGLKSIFPCPLLVAYCLLPVACCLFIAYFPIRLAYKGFELCTKATSWL